MSAKIEEVQQEIIARIIKPSEDQIGINPDNQELVGLVPQSTVGGGDCAFHAAFGEWNGQQFVCHDVVFKRKQVAQIIEECKPEAPLFIAIKEAIQYMVMSNKEGGIEIEKIRYEYQNYLKNNENIIQSAWDDFEKELKQHQSILDYIEKYTSLEKKESLSTLKLQYNQCVSEDEGLLLCMIMSLEELGKKFKEYNEVTNKDFDLTSCLLGNKKIIKEYAGFIEKQGYHLLPSELEIVAHALDLRINFYITNGKTRLIRKIETYNVNKLNEVSIFFNGVNHYERMEENFKKLKRVITQNTDNSAKKLSNLSFYNTQTSVYTDLEFQKNEESDSNLRLREQGNFWYIPTTSGVGSLLCCMFLAYLLPVCANAEILETRILKINKEVLENEMVEFKKLLLNYNPLLETKHFFDDPLFLKLLSNHKVCANEFHGDLEKLCKFLQCRLSIFNLEDVENIIFRNEVNDIYFIESENAIAEIFLLKVKDSYQLILKNELFINYFIGNDVFGGIVNIIYTDDNKDKKFFLRLPEKERYIISDVSIHPEYEMSPYTQTVDIDISNNWKICEYSYEELANLLNKKRNNIQINFGVARKGGLKIFNTEKLLEKLYKKLKNNMDSGKKVEKYLETFVSKRSENIYELLKFIKSKKEGLKVGIFFLDILKKMQRIPLHKYPLLMGHVTCDDEVPALVKPHMLHLASELDWPELVSELLKKYKKNIRDNYGRTAIHYASQSDDVKILKILLKDQEANEKDVGGLTPLMYACVSESETAYEVVKYLLTKGAEINHTDQSGFSSLDYALARNNNIEILECLIKNGALFNYSNMGDSLYVYYYNYTKGNYLESENLTPTLKLLQKLCPDKIEKYNVNKPLSLEVRQILLNESIFKNELVLLKYILILGVDLNKKNFGNDNYLISAIKSNCSLDFIKTLLEYGADVNAKNLTHTTPLQAAIEKNRDDIVQLLLNEKKINVYYINPRTGESYFHIAIKSKNLISFKFLLEKVKGMRTRPTNLGSTLLEYCIIFEFNEGFNLLTKKNAINKNLKKFYETTYLERIEEHIYFIKQVIDNGLLSQKMAKEKGLIQCYSNDGGSGLDNKVYVNVIRNKRALNIDTLGSKSWHGPYSVLVERDNSIDPIGFHKNDKNKIASNAKYEFYRRLNYSFFVVTSKKSLMRVESQKGIVESDNPFYEDTVSNSISNQVIDLILLPEILRNFKNLISKINSVKIVYIDEIHDEAFKPEQGTIYIDFVKSCLNKFTYQKKKSDSQSIIGCAYAPNYFPVSLHTYFDLVGGDIITHVVRCESSKFKPLMDEDDQCFDEISDFDIEEPSLQEDDNQDATLLACFPEVPKTSSTDLEIETDLTQRLKNIQIYSEKREEDKGNQTELTWHNDMLLNYFEASVTSYSEVEVKADEMLWYLKNGLTYDK